MKNIIHVMLNELRMSLRDRRTFSFMIAFPIILMLILGTALSNVFTNGIELNDMKLLYKNSITQPQLKQSWEAFEAAITKEGVQLIPLSGDEDPSKQIERGNSTGYAQIDDSGIRFYSSSADPIESTIVGAMLSSFADKYNLTAAALKSNPQTAQVIIAAAAQPQNNYVQEASLQADRKPNSIDYYAMSMSVMIAMYSCMSASSLIIGERRRNTAMRLSAAPISKGEVLAGKVIGNTIINFLCVMIVVLVSRFMFKADWGSHFGLTLLVLLSVVMLSVSLGLGMGYLSGDKGRMILLLFIQLASLMGGIYFPIEKVSGFMKYVVNMSPLKWANEALTTLIYTNDMSAAWPTIGLNAAISIVFLSIAVGMMRGRETL